MKKQIISKVKSRIPVVKRTSYDVEKARREQSEQTVAQLANDVSVLSRELHRSRLSGRRDREYTKWVAMHYPDSNMVANQRSQSVSFAYQPKISIILPVYNTDPGYLRACLDSVIRQSYVNWQLCIVDDASSDKQTLGVLTEYKNKKDPRIKIKHSKRNGHISVASNLAIDMAEGEYIALLDHDDVLWPNALFEAVNFMQFHRDADFIYSDEDKIEADGFIHYNPYFKPDWSPHLLECVNYITHFSVLRTSLVRSVGGFDSHMVGTQDWDLFLRVSEKTDKIYHVPTVLYSWRAHEGSTALSLDSKSYVLSNQEAALSEHFKRSKPEYQVELQRGAYNFWYAKYGLVAKPLVSIVIPTKDKVDYLRRCVESIFEMTDYHRYEIVIVDTGSTEEDTKEYYRSLKERYGDKKLRIKKFTKKPFNYSDTCNYGAQQARGEYFIMLNNDTEVGTSSWISDMLGYAQQPSIAAVGVKLLYPSGQIQHAGVAMGIGSLEPVAGHPGIQMDGISTDNLQTPYTETIRDVSGVTAACLMVSKEKYWEVGGFDPIYRVTFNDVDLCLKFKEKGYTNIYLPFVQLNHHESISVGRALENRDMTELNMSAKLMRKRWGIMLDYDPFYNQNFDILSSQFDLDVNPRDAVK